MRRLSLLFILLLLTACTSSPELSGEPSSETAEQPAASSVSKSASGELEVSAPARGLRVSSPLRIVGRARVYENRVHFRLRAKGQELARGLAIASPPDVGLFGPFEGELSWEGAHAGATAELEVFAIRPKDGVPDHVVSIPLLLK